LILVNKKKYYIFLLLFIFIAIFLWVPFLISAIYPQKYCLDNYCIKRPTNFMFTRFVSESENQSAFCFYTLSCKNKYTINDHQNMLIFNDLSGSQFSLGITKENQQNIYADNEYLHQMQNCKYSAIIEEDNIYSVNGVFLNQTHLFYLFSDKLDLVSNALNEICSLDSGYYDIEQID